MSCASARTTRLFAGRWSIFTMIGGTQSGARWRAIRPNESPVCEFKHRLNEGLFSGLLGVISPDNIDIDQQPDSAAFPQHECGLFGVFGHPNAAVLTYYGLFALQHRGQESAGIVTSNGPGSTFHLHKDMGLVSQVLGQEELEKLKGTRAIGHTR